jgi:uncharacterized protein
MTLAFARTSMLRVAFATLAAVWLALAPAHAQQQPKYPAFTGFVVDEAGILSAQAKQQLTQSLGEFQTKTHEQIVVATVKSLQGTAIEDYGYQLGRAWGVGEKGKNTGAILLVAPNERAVRIEVGYGFEGQITDALSRQIIEQSILPAFRTGDYDRGVILGVRGIMAALGYQPTGASAQVPAKSTGQIPPFVFIVFIFLLFAFLRSRATSPAGPWRRSSRGAYPVIFPMGGGGFGGGGFGGGDFGGGFGGGGGGSFGGGGATGRW